MLRLESQMVGLAKIVEVTGVKDHTGMTSIVMLRFKECVNKFYSDKGKISFQKESVKSIYNCLRTLIEPFLNK
jgi:hypothetical protein